MGRCATCKLEKPTLTLAHVFPKGLLDRIITEQPRQVFRQKAGGYFEADAVLIKDECEECQQNSSEIFDSRVEEFCAILLALNTHKPTSITVDEPWFTLYLMRIFWATRRNRGIDVVPEEIKDAVRLFITSKGCRTEFAEQTFKRIKITYCQEPKELMYKGKPYPLMHFEAGQSEFSDIPTNIWSGYLRISRLKIHIYSAPHSMIDHEVVLQFWEHLRHRMKEAFSEWKTPRSQTYSFVNFCSRTLDPKHLGRYIETLSIQAKTSAYKKASKFHR